MKENIDKLDLVKIKNFSSQKTLLRKWKYKPWTEKNICKVYLSTHLYMQASSVHT